MTQWAETSRKSSNVTFTACSLDGKPLHILLEDVKICFEPSVYGGTGEETRKSICFSGVNEELKKQIVDIEESIGATTSCIKDDVFRCKVDFEKVRSYDASKNIIDCPKVMRGWNVNARIHIRGKWFTRQSSGICLNVTDLMFNMEDTHEPLCPF